jgi:hypothetical protein
MILGFKEQFKPLILSGQKIHTIRQDFNDRWIEGLKIHFATGVRTDKYNCFKTGICTGIQKIQIKPLTETIIFMIDNKPVYFPEKYEREIIAKNDGFNSIQDFFKWFNKDFDGKIIYWTDFKY